MRNPGSTRTATSGHQWWIGRKFLSTFGSWHPGHGDGFTTWQAGDVQGQVQPAGFVAGIDPGGVNDLLDEPADGGSQSPAPVARMLAGGLGSYAYPGPAAPYRWPLFYWRVHVRPSPVETSCIRNPHRPCNIIVRIWISSSRSPPAPGDSVVAREGAVTTPVVMARQQNTGM